MHKHPLNNVTRTKEPQRAQLLRQYAQMPEATRDLIHEIAADHLERLDTLSRRDRAPAALILALRQYGYEKGGQYRREKDPGHAARVDEIRRSYAPKRLKRPDKQSAAYRITTHHFFLVHQLRTEDNLSWPLVARYLARHQGIRVKPNNLRNIYHRYKEDLLSSDELG